MTTVTLDTDQAQRVRGACWRSRSQRGIRRPLIEDLVQDMVADTLRLARPGLSLPLLALHALDRINPRVEQGGQRRYRQQYDEMTARLPEQHDPSILPDALLWQQLERLPLWHGMSLELLVYQRDVLEYSQRELARMYGVHETRICHRLARARTALRQVFQPDAP